MIEHPYWFKRKVMNKDITIVGTPTINDGLISGFSSSNYFKIPTPFNPGNKKWELTFKLKTSSEAPDGVLFAPTSTNNNILGLISNGYFRLYYSYDGTTWNHYVELTSRLQPNMDYWIKCGFNRTHYYCKLSITGDSWMEYSRIDSTPINPNPLPIEFGTDGERYFNGTIDLFGSYITIDDEMWWKFYDEKYFWIKKKLEELSPGFTYTETDTTVTVNSYTGTDNIVRLTNNEEKIFMLAKPDNSTS